MNYFSYTICINPNPWSKTCHPSPSKLLMLARWYTLMQVTSFRYPRIKFNKPCLYSFLGVSIFLGDYWTSIDILKHRYVYCSVYVIICLLHCSDIEVSKVFPFPHPLNTVKQYTITNVKCRRICIASEMFCFGLVCGFLISQILKHPNASFSKTRKLDWFLSHFTLPTSPETFYECSKLSIVTYMEMTGFPHVYWGQGLGII